VVTDAMGSIVSDQMFQPTLDVTTFAPGVYFVNLLEAGKRVVTQRFVKM